MSLTHSTGLPLGSPAPDFSLPGIDGQVWTLSSFGDATALVVVFTCNHCPYAIAAEDRLIELQIAYQDRGVRFVLINPNDASRYEEDSFDRMIERARDKRFPFPYLYDESQNTARAYDAACTPDIFLFDQTRHLFYAGRIDDHWQDPTRVTRQDLRTAIDDLLAHRALSFQPIPSMGCSIKWRV